MAWAYQAYPLSLLPFAWNTLPRPDPHRLSCLLPNALPLPLSVSSLAPLNPLQNTPLCEIKLVYGLRVYKLMGLSLIFPTRYKCSWGLVPCLSSSDCIPTVRPFQAHRWHSMSICVLNEPWLNPHAIIQLFISNSCLILILMPNSSKETKMWF